MKKLLIMLSFLCAAVANEGTLRFDRLDASNETTIHIKGGQGPYTYTLNGTMVMTSDTSVTFMEALSGNATISVEDTTTNEVISLSAFVQDSQFSAIFTSPCNDQNNGSLTIESNEFDFYTLIRDGQVVDSNGTGDFQNLQPGSYSLETDANLLILNFTLAALDPVEISFTTEPATCGLADGKIIIDAITGGGCSPYNVEAINQNDLNITTITFPPETTFMNVKPGDYLLQATSDNGCSGTTDFFKVDATSLTLEATSTPTSCFDQSDGTITVNTMGSISGNIVYTIPALTLESPPTPAGQPYTFMNLPAGTYMVEAASVELGCTGSTNVQVSQPDALNITSFNAKSTSCNAANGQITLQEQDIVGGTPPYTASLSGPVNASGMVPVTFSNLSAGNYMLSISDTNGCTDSLTDPIYVTPSPSLTIDSQTSNPSCSGELGTITITANFEFPSDAINSTVTANVMSSGVNESQVIPASGDSVMFLVPSGSYIVTVTASAIIGISPSLCIRQDMVTVTEPAPLNGNFYVISPTCDESNAEVIVTVSGGTPPYSVVLIDSNSDIHGPKEITDEFGSVSFYGIPSGATSVDIVDSNSCTTAPLSFPVPPSIGVMIDEQTITAATCSDRADGSIFILATGYSSELSYQLNTEDPILSSDGVLFEHLLPGKYTITIKDLQSGCMAMAMVTVPAPPELTLSLMKQDETCEAGNGSITAMAMGGTPAYSYTLNGMPVPGPHITGLSAGPYTVVVTDEHQCTAESSVTLSTTPAVRIVTIDTQDPLCFDSNDGHIAITATPVGPDLTYTVDGMIQKSMIGHAAFSNLAPALYIVSVIDEATKCFDQTSVRLSAPEELSFTFTKQDTTCDQPNGSIMITSITGGTFPYFGTLTGPVNGTGLFFTELPPGSYTVTVTDAHGCTAVENEIMIAPSETVEITSVVGTPPTCPGFTDGMIAVSAISPVSSRLRYTLLGPVEQEEVSSNGVKFTNLPPGTYMVIVTDDTSGCKAATSITLPEISPLNFRQPQVTPVTCKNADNGTVLLNPEQIVGGTAPYSYSIGTRVGFIPAGDPFMNLQAGTYAVTVRDAHGCTSLSKRVTVPPAENICINKVCTTPAHKGKHDGTLRVDATSKGRLIYALNGGQFQESPLFTNLRPGTYRVAVNRKGDTTSECATCCATVKKAKKECYTSKR